MCGCERVSEAWAIVALAPHLGQHHDLLLLVRRDRADGYLHRNGNRLPRTGDVLVQGSVHDAVLPPPDLISHLIVVLWTVLPPGKLALQRGDITAREP